MTFRMRFIGLVTTCAASALAGAAMADPPGRVGRISDVEGPVSFQPPEDDLWTYATRNFPVVAGEAFWTADQGRTEVQVGALAARLDNDTELDVVSLDYGATRLSLAQGSMDLRLWRVPRGGVSILTPAGEVRIDYAGLYRIDVGGAQEGGNYPPVEVSVFEGAAGAPSPQGLVEVDAGEAALVYPGYAPQAVDIQDAAIDDWGRNLEAQRREQGQYPASLSMTGYEDLAAYGQFQTMPGYGQVWFPQNLPADWQPYRYGHWAYVEPWGWTWVDDQSWGFAPFHYGRWAQVGGRWGWFPGQQAAEPVYAPALVAFIGGGGWSVGFGSRGGGAAMGWVPLAPGEVYRPTYQVSPTYLRQVNVTNVSQTTIKNITVNNITINQYHNAPAAVVVPAASFARGAPVQAAVVVVSAAAIAAAPITTMASRLAPTAQARAGAPVAPNGGGERPSAPGGVVTAAPPPARLQAVRTAVAAQPAGSLRPPVIVGSVAAPPRPRPPGAAPAFIAPSQIRNPAAQARVAPPVVHAGPPPAASPGAPVLHAAPLAPLGKAPTFGASPGSIPPQGPANGQAAAAARAAEAAAAERQTQSAAAAQNAGASKAAQAEAAQRAQAAESAQAQARAQAQLRAQAQVEAEAAARTQAASAQQREAAAAAQRGAAAQAAATQQQAAAQREEAAQAQARTLQQQAAQQAQVQAQAQAAARQRVAQQAAMAAEAKAKAPPAAPPKPPVAPEPKKKPPEEQDRPPQ